MQMHGLLDKRPVKSITFLLGMLIINLSSSERTSGKKVHTVGVQC